MRTFIQSLKITSVLTLLHIFSPHFTGNTVQLSTIKEAKCSAVHHVTSHILRRPLIGPQASCWEPLDYNSQLKNIQKKQAKNKPKNWFFSFKMTFYRGF